MKKLNPNKLNVVNLLGDKASEENKSARRYTLTHSDLTGEMLLTIGLGYDKKQIAGLYTRLMRDEVLADLVNINGNWELHIHCHVSGGLIFGTAKWRNDILKHELPLAIEAIRFGDRCFFASQPETDEAPVKVYFHSHRKAFDRVEHWGIVTDYA
jgi:hypothetical protein